MATRPIFRPVAPLLLPVALLAAACDDGGTDPEGEDALSEVITAVAVPEANIQAAFHTGDPPSVSGGPSIEVTNLTAFIPGGTGLLRIESDEDFSRVVVTMDDHFGHYILDLPQAVRETLVGLSMAQTLGENQFSIDVAAGLGAAIGNYSGSLVNVIEVGTGDVQINVSWDAPSDVDLHVVDPSGEEIYWLNNISDSGGELDLDSNAGCGIDAINAENITFDDAPTGSYTVRLDYWSSCGVGRTNWVVTVRVRGRPSETFTGSFTGPGDQGGAGDGELIRTFTF